MRLHVSRRGRLGGAVALAATAALATTAPAAAPIRHTVRAAAPGVNPLGASANPSLNRDGGLLAFDSAASNLGPRDANDAVRDVYLMDPSRPDAIVLISADARGRAGNGRSHDPVLAADAPAVAFVSEASSLVAGDTNRVADVFVRALGTPLERVSIGPAGQATQASGSPAISADGRRVAFATAAALVPQDRNGTVDVYVRDRAARTTTLVSVNGAGRAGNGASGAPAISGDGGTVSFASTATDLVAADRNGAGDVFVRELARGRTQRVSVSSRGAAQNRAVLAPFVQISSLSRDGRYVAFDSDATNLVPSDGNSDTDVFVRDRRLGRTVRASVSESGREGDNDSFSPMLSSDGRRVAFDSFAENLAPGDAAREDVFVHDLRTGINLVVDTSVTDRPRGRELVPQLLQRPAISGDGLRAAFVSGADNLVGADRNGLNDVFVRDLASRNLRATIRGGARRVTHSRRPSVTVAASSPGARLVCRIGRVHVSCRPGRALRLPTLGLGPHTFTATAGAPGTYLGPQVARQVIVVRR